MKIFKRKKQSVSPKTPILPKSKEAEPVIDSNQTQEITDELSNTTAAPETGFAAAEELQKEIGGSALEPTVKIDTLQARELVGTSQPQEESRTTAA